MTPVEQTLESTVAEGRFFLSFSSLSSLFYFPSIKSRRLDMWRTLLRSRGTHRIHLNLTASASTPPEHHHLNMRSSELGNKQASNATHNRSSLHCLHASEFHRSPKSPPTLKHFKPKTSEQRTTAFFP
ncbi:hypothetical protein YC2023_120118 [Brassica napus]